MLKLNNILNILIILGLLIVILAIYIKLKKIIPI